MDFEIWCASLDLKKAFDRVEFVCVFQALERQGVPQDYVHLLRTLYKTQIGSVEGGSAFPINRGVGQGDVFSPSLFNAVLEEAVRRCKSRLTTQGVHVGATRRLTNIRFFCERPSVSEDVVQVRRRAVHVGRVGRGEAQQTGGEGTGCGKGEKG